jgi:hypothetical protein
MAVNSNNKCNVVLVLVSLKNINDKLAYHHHSFFCRLKL